MNEIKGFVRNNANKAVAEALVYLKHSANSHNDIAQVTSVDGYFNLGVFPNGEYTVGITAPNGETKTISFSIPMAKHLDIYV